jgi:hypothetical protein
MADETATDVGGGGRSVVVVIVVGTIDIEVTGGGRPVGGQGACIEHGTSPTKIYLS